MTTFTDVHREPTIFECDACGCRGAAPVGSLPEDWSAVRTFTGDRFVIRHRCGPCEGTIGGAERQRLREAAAALAAQHT